MKKKRAIILGAGPIGLITAWKLLENGWEVEIYEKHNIVGGLCRTWKWNNFLLDVGPHIFHTPDKKLAEFWEKEFGDLFLKGDFWCKNVRGDNFKEYWDYPISWESISRYPKNLKNKIIEELENRKEEEKATAKNYSEYVRAQVGPTLQEMFFKTYPKKIWGISTDQMTPEWAPKRLEFRQKVTPFYHNQWNAVGKLGTGCIYDRIKENILKLGGKIYLEHEVENIVPGGNYIEEIKFVNKQSIQVNKEDFIISSLPITTTARFLGYQSKLRFRGVYIVSIAYNIKSILPEDIHWLYYGSEDVYFNRISEPKKMSPNMSPEGETYLAIEITFSPGDEIDSMETETLVKNVITQVEKVGLAKSENVTDWTVTREEFVYPLQYAGYTEELAKTRSVILQFSQLYSIGTGGDFNYADSQILFHKAFDTVAILTGKDSVYTQEIRQAPVCSLNKIVTINGRKIGDGEQTFIIAEAGLNHNGSLKMAKQLVDAAIAAKADAIKFQTFKAKNRVSRKVKSVKYAETIIGLEETLFDMFDRLELSFENQKELFDYAHDRQIEIFSTPFDFESVDLLESLGVNLYKIASMDLVNLPLIEYIAKTGKPIILSTGMSTYGQIEEAVSTVAQAGNPNLILLHCNSSYPAAPDEMNLNVISTLKKCFQIPVGLSDHTFGLFVTHTAIAIGANVIERHFTLDRTLEGPDHLLSSNPEEFSDLVQLSHRIPKILGNGVKRIQPNEYDTINTQRKSLYAACDIEKGQQIDRDMIAIKGPGGGLLPKYLGIVIGRVAKEKIPMDYPITWSVI